MLCPFCALQFFVCFVYFVVTLIIHVEQRAFFGDSLSIAGFRFGGLLAGSTPCCWDGAFCIGGNCLAFPATLHPPRATLLVVQALFDFFGVAFVIELQQTLQNFTPCGLTDREADPLLGFVEAVAEGEVGPAVGSGNGLIHFLV